ncbi:MAG: HAD hydrolase-like protein [Chloroflexota bacterium]|nr:HAD hydrolase-like protein [Chloroflexota bacterium]
MIGALLCEVEDVLATTGPLRQAALVRAFAEDGGALTQTRDVRNGTWASTRDAVRRALGDRDGARDETAITILAHRADRYFAALVATGVSLAPGARELIALAAGRWRLAIVTTMERATVEYVLSSAELESFFEVIIASDDMVAEKPSPDGYRRALARMRRRRALETGSAVALENGAAGAAAAWAAGLRCVVIRATGDMGAIEADVLLSSLAGQTPTTLEAALTMEAVR